MSREDAPMRVSPNATPEVDGPTPVRMSRLDLENAVTDREFQIGRLEAVVARVRGMNPERLAALFHATYERLAPEYSYQTRKASAVPWEAVPEPNRSLMIAVAGEVLVALAGVVPGEVDRG